MEIISKDYDERKAEILNAAQMLFHQKGYENTSINDVLESVGIAKGTFYYYFKSKEDLLDSVAELLALRALEVLEKIEKEKGLNAVDKLNKMFEVAGRFKVANKELLMNIFEIMYRDENIRLTHKIYQRGIAIYGPIFSRVIKQGVAEGLFNTQFDDEMGELLIRLFKSLNDKFASLIFDVDEKPENVQFIIDLLKMYKDTIERILGAKKGSIKFGDENIVKLLAP